MRRILVAVVVCFPASGAAQNVTAELLGRLGAAESARDHARARLIADSIVAISGGDPTFLVVGAIQAALAADDTGAYRRMLTATEWGFTQVAAALRDSAFRPYLDRENWTALIASARARAEKRDTALRRELLRLASTDQANRSTNLDSVIRVHGRGSRQADSVLAELERRDRPIQERMRQIIAARGWPSRSLVGDDGAHAAWLILQHMPQVDQARHLDDVRRAAAAREGRPGDAAYLEDRVLVGMGKPQLYGTQLRWPERGAVPTLYPIADSACVDVRRAARRLMPLADYVAPYGIVVPPGDRVRAPPPGCRD